MNKKEEVSKIVSKWPRSLQLELVDWLRAPEGSQVYAGGSRVYGEFNKFSDLDIVVISKEGKPDIYTKFFVFYGIKCHLSYYKDISEARPWGDQKLVLPYYNLKTQKMLPGNPYHVKYRIYWKDHVRGYGIGPESKKPLSLADFLNPNIIK